MKEKKRKERRVTRHLLPSCLSCQVKKDQLITSHLHHVNTSPPHHPNISPPHHLSTSPPHHLITPPSHYLSTSSYHHLTTLPPHHLTTSPSHYLSTSAPQHLSTSPPHHLTTSRSHDLATSTLSPQHLTTSPPYHLTTSLPPTSPPYHIASSPRRLCFRLKLEPIHTLLPGKQILMWHLQDSVWKVPKLNVNLTLESVYAVATPLNVALADVFAACLKVNFTDPSSLL
jgi:hypothetical protein